MKVAALAALSVLIALPTHAGQRHRQSGLLATNYDNNGHYTTLRATAPMTTYRSRRSKLQRTIATGQHRPPTLNANGNMVGVVISLKTGAHARVGIAYLGRFQAYIDDVETNHGARVLFMNGIRPGRCSIFSEHPCGKALDVCQLRRGVVDPRCKLPGRIALSQIAASHGLFEGGLWCDSDYGHAQIGVTAPACGGRRVRIVQQ